MWKNITFLIGLSWLIYGATTYEIRDWDVGVSLVMALSTYFTADWVITVIRRREYKQWFKAAFLTWFSVSGSYTAYWLLMGHPEYMVSYQWITSLCLYALCGVIWSSLPTHQEALALIRSMKAENVPSK